MANRYEIAHRAWHVLIEQAKRKDAITYSDLGKEIGVPMALAVRHGLHVLFELCEEKGWPHLTSIVINKKTRRPGSFLLHAISGNLQEEQKRARAFDWSGIPAPFPDHTWVQLGNGWPKEPDHAVLDELVLRNGRGAYQNRFRNILLGAYGRQCALCDTRLEIMLVASHIVPWAADHRQRLNPRNGLLLCRTHDALFENGYLLIHPDLKVEQVSLEEVEAVGSALHRYVAEATRSTLRKPARGKPPDPDLLRERIRINGGARRA